MTATMTSPLATPRFTNSSFTNTPFIDPLLVTTSRPRTAAAGSTRSTQAHVAVSRPSERTYRRRRIVVGVAVVFASVTGVIASGAVASGPAEEQSSVPRTVIAKPGDTLWDIARSIVPKGAIGDLVTDMVRLNGSNIEPGQVVRIP